MFLGCTTALITPFKNGLLDKTALIALLERQPGNVLVCGSTGEGMLLNSEEREEIINVALDVAQKQVIIGCGAPSTNEALDQVIHAQLLGAHAVLLVAPFYSKPQDDGVFDYFQTIHDQTKIPIILYNNPARTGASISPANISKLAQAPRIVGLKESSSNMPVLFKQYDVPDGFLFLCGEDDLFAESLHAGADGIISVGGNVHPHIYNDMYNAWKNQDSRFKSYARQVQMLSAVLSPNPSCVKYIMHRMGFCELEYKSPLTQPRLDTQKRIETYLEFEKNHQVFEEFSAA